MASPESGSAIRACAQAVIQAIAAHGHDTAKLTEALRAPLAALVARPDLREAGVPRVGNHVANSQYLYYDGVLSILLFELPNGKPVPVHDHGNWESMAIYRGRVKHTVYQRRDDGSVPGFADLAVIDDRVLEPGDSVVIAPPADIHGFMALEDDSWGITVASGTYKAERCYFQPDSRTVVTRNPRG
jgi:Predicted metal-dependent enzyme of the double-stranded beta helix superfamily